MLFKIQEAIHVSSVQIKINKWNWQSYFEWNRRGHRGRDCKVVGFGEVYFIQHYVIKFVSDLRQVCCFLRVPRFRPPIKLTTTWYCWHIMKLVLNNMTLYFEWNISAYG
jgi:hypothetical protein